MGSVNKSNNINSGEYKSLYHIHSEHSGSNAYLFSQSNLSLSVANSTLNIYSQQPLSNVFLFSGTLNATSNFPSVTYAQLNKRCIKRLLVKQNNTETTVDVLHDAGTMLFAVQRSLFSTTPSTFTVTSNSVIETTLIPAPYALQALTDATVEIIEITIHSVINLPVTRTVNISEGSIFYCNPILVRVTSGNVKMFFAD